VKAEPLRKESPSCDGLAMRPECPKNFGETISAGYTSVLAGRGPVWEIISLAWIGRNLVWSLQNYCTNCWDLLGLLSAPEKKYGLDNELMIEWLFSKAIFTSLNCHWSIWPEIDRSVLNYSCLFVSLSHGYLNPASSVLFNRIFSAVFCSNNRFKEKQNGVCS